MEFLIVPALRIEMAASVQPSCPEYRSAFCTQAIVTRESNNNFLYNFSSTHLNRKFYIFYFIEETTNLSCDKRYKKILIEKIELTVL